MSNHLPQIQTQYPVLLGKSLLDTDSSDILLKYKEGVDPIESHYPSLLEKINDKKMKITSRNENDLKEIQEYKGTILNNKNDQYILIFTGDAFVIERASYIYNNIQIVDSQLPLIQSSYPIETITQRVQKTIQQSNRSNSILKEKNSDSSKNIENESSSTHSNENQNININIDSESPSLSSIPKKDSKDLSFKHTSSIATSQSQSKSCTIKDDFYYDDSDDIEQIEVFGDSKSFQSNKANWNKQESDFHSDLDDDGFL